MRILPRTSPAAFCSLALLLPLACSDLAHATRDLIIAQPVTNNVLRFDGITGAAKGAFIAAGAGGLVSPAQMILGPDGKLYVLCGGSTQQIHRFHGATGAYEGIAVDAASTRMEGQSDFMLMPSTNDFLVVNSGTLRRISRFNSTTGAFVSYYINSSGSTAILFSPTSIIIGPDGNYWISSSNGTNKVTRFSITNGARINDPFLE